MRQVFSILGTIWSDIGKINTDLNMMLSSPLFRHKDDPDSKKITLVKTKIETTETPDEPSTPSGATPDKMTPSKETGEETVDKRPI